MVRDATGLLFGWGQPAEIKESRPIVVRAIRSGAVRRRDVFENFRCLADFNPDLAGSSRSDPVRSVLGVLSSDLWWFRVEGIESYEARLSDQEWSLSAWKESTDQKPSSYLSGCAHFLAPFQWRSTAVECARACSRFSVFASLTVPQDPGRNGKDRRISELDAELETSGTVASREVFSKSAVECPRACSRFSVFSVVRLLPLSVDAMMASFETITC